MESTARMPIAPPPWLHADLRALPPWVDAVRARDVHRLRFRAGVITGTGTAPRSVMGRIDDAAGKKTVTWRGKHRATTRSGRGGRPEANAQRFGM